MEKIIKNICNQIKSKIKETPEIAIVLGSGLSDIIDCLENPTTILYSELDGMLQTKVEGHKNQFIVGKLHGKTVIVMRGRFHLYDGFSAKQVCLPIYLFKELGVKTLILTNASGGIADKLNAGDILLIEDHINHTNQNAMIGGSVIDYGKQFVDMTEPYDTKYREIVKQCAKDLNIKVETGTYMQVVGPYYETKADIKMAKILGADAIGMSTVVEVEAARHCDLSVLALSMISNKACGLGNTALDHKDVLETAKTAGTKMIKIISEFIKRV